MKEYLLLKFRDLISLYILDMCAYGLCNIMECAPDWSFFVFL